MLSTSDWCRLIALPSTLKTSPRSPTTVRYWLSYSQLKPGTISQQRKYTGYMLILRKISTTNQGLIINKESCGSRRWRKRDHSHRNPLRFGRATTVRILTVSLPWSSDVYLAKRPYIWLYTLSSSLKLSWNIPWPLSTVKFSSNQSENSSSSAWSQG